MPARRARRASAEPASQTRFRKPELMSTCPDRLVTGSGELGRAPPELRRVCCRHPDSSQRRVSRLTVDVRKTGATAPSRTRRNRLLRVRHPDPPNATAARASMPGSIAGSWPGQGPTRPNRSIASGTHDTLLRRAARGGEAPEPIPGFRCIDNNSGFLRRRWAAETADTTDRRAQRGGAHLYRYGRPLIVTEVVNGFAQAIPRRADLFLGRCSRGSRCSRQGRRTRRRTRPTAAHPQV